uniref:DNA mismatch repair protein MSH2 n=1 Tax=Graphocephala atropunctata TaxID=36148 RepID=A0A1B6KJA7_9HEMI
MLNKSSQLISMDSIQQNLFVSFFKGLPEKPATTVRFFNRIEYYTLHGSDAVFTAKEFFKSSAVIKYIGSGKDNLESLILNKAQFEGFVRELLLVKHYRVEVYSKPNKAANNSWTLEFKGSPGNLSQFEDLLFTNSDQVTGSGIIAVRPATDHKSKIVGVALVDTTENTFSVCEFADDDYYSNLEGLVVQHTPRECLLPSENLTDVETVKKIIERSGLLVTCRKRSEFNRDDTTQDLNRLIKFEEGQQQSVNSLPESKFTTAISALGAIIRYLELCNDGENFGQFKLQLLDHSRFVHLDSAAVAALSLLPQPGHSAARHHSVLGLLDHCRTQQGHRLMAQWVKQPLRDLAVITERHDVVEALTQDTELRQALTEDHLRRIPDLQVLANRLQRKKASMQDCYRIYQALKRFPLLVETLQENENQTLHALITSPMKDLFTDTEKLLEMIESTLDLSLVDKGEFLIKADFDDDLKELRYKMDSYEEDIKKTLNKAARDLSLEAGKTIKLESNSQYGYFFRVTLKEEKVIRNVKGYTELDANKSGLRFRSSELTDLNNDYQQARDEYTKQQEAIVTEVISVAAGYSHTLQSLSHLIAQLDVLTSLALVAVSAPVPYVRPVMHPSGTGVLSLKQARHPCLEMQESVSYIANDVHFKQGECTFYMVTGPNMGGKSTYIRSAGVVALMAHIGSLVPCESAEISVLDSILARVGASDSQVKGMSTFMVEMVETASIIRTATSNSLVIIDELGRGTSTFEGCGIAWAIAEHLAVTAKSFTLFATHFHELTRLSESVETLANLHVTAVTEQDSLTLLYQVRPGACDQSFGIHVAHMAKFPQQVIQDAKRKLSELEDYQSLIVAENDMKKRKIIQEGEKIMEEMIEECKTLAKQNLLDSDLEAAVLKLKEEAMARNNPYITALLSK